MIVIVGIFISYKLMNSGSHNRAHTSAPTSTPSNFDPNNTYGLNGIRSDWPNLTESSAIDLQNKLTKNYYVILDDSGSMESGSCASGHHSRLSGAIDALAAFVEGLPPQANFGVMSFNEGKFTEQIPLGSWDGGDVRRLSKRIFATGNTPLATAILRGYEALRKQAAAQLGYGEYHLVVITDGQASEGEYPDVIVNRILTESPVDIHTIGFCIDSDHVLNQPNLLSYQSANDVKELRRGLQEVLAEAPEFTVSSFQ